MLACVNTGGSKYISLDSVTRSSPLLVLHIPSWPVFEASDQRSQIGTSRPGDPIFFRDPTASGDRTVPGGYEQRGAVMEGLLGLELVYNPEERMNVSILNPNSRSIATEHIHCFFHFGKRRKPQSSISFSKTQCILSLSSLPPRFLLLVLRPFPPKHSSIAAHPLQHPPESSKSTAREPISKSVAKQPEPRSRPQTSGTRPRTIATWPTIMSRLGMPESLPPGVEVAVEALAGRRQSTMQL